MILVGDLITTVIVVAVAVGTIWLLRRQRERNDNATAASVVHPIVDTCEDIEEGRLTRRLLAGELDPATYRAAMEHLAHAG